MVKELDSLGSYLGEGKMKRRKRKVSKKLSKVRSSINI